VTTITSLPSHACLNRQGVALEFFKCLPPLDTPLISWDNCSALRVFISGIPFETSHSCPSGRPCACLSAVLPHRASRLSGCACMHMAIPSHLGRQLCAQLEGTQRRAPLQLEADTYS